MIETVNGAIKNATNKTKYYYNIDNVKKDLNELLIYFNLKI
jgi:macrodomain Ter protein organizer (MatP/YcbG family)